MATWRDRVQRIGNLNYPSVVRQQRLVGSVVLEVVVGRNGDLLGIHVVKPPGQKVLDDTAIQLADWHLLLHPYQPPLDEKPTSYTSREHGVLQTTPNFWCTAHTNQLIMSTATFPSLTNHFLIAMPEMKDPNFSRTVTLICQHDTDGALGSSSTARLKTSRLAISWTSLNFRGTVTPDCQTTRFFWWAGAHRTGTGAA
ncbi:MAG: hypothetical protein CM1200mP41_27510 [Gammaproteobacteria bacterium]|nr:MAG: hypothetical protein CM1200mP41_27510 [Gammaproteobacteria bacterium]